MGGQQRNPGGNMEDNEKTRIIMDETQEEQRKQWGIMR